MIKNHLKTVLLLAGLSSLLLIIGNLFGGTTGLYFAFIIAITINMAAYFFSDRLVLSMYGARPLDQQQHEDIYHIVRELTQRMQLPMPKLWIVHTPMANAFATGRNPENASIAITSGLMHSLNEHELRGVLAHELGHIRNRDILIATIAATLATAISYSAHMLHHIAFFSSMSNNNQRKSNPFALLAIAIFTPIAATIIQLALSRSREYLADETGAHYSQDPLALASALAKLENQSSRSQSHRQDYRTSTASLFIVNPFFGKGITNIFSTHPPIKERITRLHRISERGL